MQESESNLNDTCPSQILPIDSWLKGCEWDDRVDWKCQSLSRLKKLLDSLAQAASEKLGNC